jgi:hypothetical protein
VPAFSDWRESFGFAPFAKAAPYQHPGSSQSCVNITAIQ